MSTSHTARGSCLKLAKWPDVDRLAWLDGLQPANLLDAAPRPAAAWRGITRQRVEAGYGRWLSWLNDSGLLDPNTTPVSRATRERVTAYWTDLAATVAEYTVVVRLQQLGSALRVIAPGEDWTWLLRASYRLGARAVPAKDKRSRMQAPQDLLALGRYLMNRADTDVHAAPVELARLHRDGLIIALLTLRPNRGGNTGSIALDEHLCRRGAHWELDFQPQEAKQGRSIELSWPDDLVPELERYLAVYRPRLLACARRAYPPTNQLWISSHGRPMTYSALAIQVKARPKAAFGVSVNPHLFRDCAATVISTFTPEQVGDVALVLGHSTLATSERHYNQATSLRASQDHQAIVEQVRQPMSAAALKYNPKV